MADNTFELRDASDFPTVRSRTNAARPGYARQWEDEMEPFVAKAEPFAIIFAGERSEERLEDRERRHSHPRD
ncbi:hypothetical protein [Shinella oryzae]|uniref:Uncharacterized protein n=1 Tax=Shinella oryzae TaxID=2871820 RepID=A0ABY9K8R1_9HYPH|nr:hypothetical protein [Shinella oryzae]WLS04960.1 hypothetical protein Q9315_22535 [Shinella oryzae]